MMRTVQVQEIGHTARIRGVIILKIRILGFVQRANYSKISSKTNNINKKTLNSV